VSDQHRLTSADRHPFTGMDVWHLLSVRARSHAGRPFVVWQPFGEEPQVWTFDRLARESASVAAGLAVRGVTAGDRVLIHLENCPEFLVAWFACARLGAVAVTTNTRSAEDELAYFASDCAAVGAITQPAFADLVARAAPALNFLICTGHDAGVAATAGVGEPWAALARDPGRLPVRPADPLAPCSVQYTSGTTSRPKGVLWTHANALWGARCNAAQEALRPDDVHLVYLPLFHTNALAYSVLASLWVGARMVLTPKWSTSRFWDISLRHGCTWLSLMGLSVRALVGYDPIPAGHSYRLFGTGWCDLPIDAAYGVKTIGWWGMTETISHPIVGDAFLPNRPQSMGRPSPLYEIRVVRPDGGDDTRFEDTEFEESGELLVRGVRGLSMFTEYLNRPDATDESFDADGWFHTGDLVVAHADGHLSFDNRAKDMLKVGAENVSAAEVERVIAEVPGVVEVGVVGRPDVKLDEVPVAFITTIDADPAVLKAIDAACARKLADFKRPRAVYRIAQFPRSTLAKLNKVELRAVADPDADRSSAERRWIDEAAADPSGNAE
jgi:crotonobetaine/carnitine-CoA ligase